MNIQRFAAFSDGDTGGNPAGVVISDVPPPAMEMQRIARTVGYSETAFATRLGEAWNVRYFSPEAEVPFCGHATIALGAALTLQHGAGRYPLALAQSTISVEGERRGDLVSASLQSPTTRTAPVDAESLQQALILFGLRIEELDQRALPALIHAGSDHLLLMLRSRTTLSTMKYDVDAGKRLMRSKQWVTVMLCFAESSQLFHTRNAFAYGGIYEDPATGAAAAALAGYLRDVGWPHEGRIDIHQGDDMGVPCRLKAEFSSVRGSSIRVSGTARLI